MTRDRLMRLSKRWFILLQRLYPADFRDEMGTAVVHGDPAKFSGSVTRRRHELAVSLALGADLVMLGLLIGAPGIYIAGGLIRGVLVGVSPTDPFTVMAAAVVGLLMVTLATCYVPARRASGIDPAKLLRQE